MIRSDLDADKRQALRVAEARVREIMKPSREAARIAAAKLRKERDQALTGGFGQRQAANRDVAFQRWIHDEGLTCICCDIEGGPAYDGHNPIEAAHQWLVRGPMKGKRAGHDTCLPICRWHHQLAPNACDKGQRAFWTRLGLVELLPDLCAALYAAFKAGARGAPVIRDFINRRAA